MYSKNVQCSVMTLYNVQQSTLYIIHYILYIVQCTGMLYNRVNYTLYIVHYTSYSSVHYTLYIIHYTLYIVHCTVVYNVLTYRHCIR